MLSKIIFVIGTLLDYMFFELALVWTSIAVQIIVINANITKIRTGEYPSYRKKQIDALTSWINEGVELVDNYFGRKRAILWATRKTYKLEKIGILITFTLKD